MPYTAPKNTAKEVRYLNKDFTSSNDEKDRNIFKITMVFSIVGDPNRFDELTFTVEGSGD